MTHSPLVSHAVSLEAKAIAKAIQCYDVQYKNTTLIEIECYYSRSHEQWIASVEGIDDTHAYQLKVRSDDLAIVEESKKLLPMHQANANKRRRLALELDDVLPFDQIEHLVKEAMPEAEPLSYELEREGAVMEWEVLVKRDQVTYEIEIDGETGAILDIEKD